MHSQEAHSKILDSFKVNVTISDWSVVSFYTTTTYNIRYNITIKSHANI
jgi:hypothetical protein